MNLSFAGKDYRPKWSDKALQPEWQAQIAQTLAYANMRVAMDGGGPAPKVIHAVILAQTLEDEGLFLLAEEDEAEREAFNFRRKEAKKALRWAVTDALTDAALWAAYVVLGLLALGVFMLATGG